ncbi:MAG: hypothetical protein LH473_02800 [Chitinophagales bacterium]|nr:hypothetical protein [Chitinophagales bacterium]
MSVKSLHQLPNEFYFCTFTCCQCINLFEITDTYSEVYNWFGIAEKKNFHICAYVIMPNHLHFIISTPSKNADLNTLVSNAKRFMAYEIVARLKSAGNFDVLNKLSNEVSPSDRKRGKLHQVFEPSFDARKILSEEMLIQKINYIHHNPVKGIWKLADDFILYPHSSAAFYETGKQGLFNIIHYEKIIEGERGL